MSCQATDGHQISGWAGAAAEVNGRNGRGGVSVGGGDDGEDAGHVQGAGGAVRAGEGHHAHGQGTRPGVLESGAALRWHVLGNYLFDVELINSGFLSNICSLSPSFKPFGNTNCHATRESFLAAR